MKSLARSNRGDEWIDRSTCPSREKHSTKAFLEQRSSDIICNAEMLSGRYQFCKLQDEGQSLMRVAMTQLNLSARAYHGILKLAWTIADLAGSDEILSCASGGGVAISSEDHNGWFIPREGYQPSRCVLLSCNRHAESRVRSKTVVYGTRRA